MPIRQKLKTAFKFASPAALAGDYVKDSYQASQRPSSSNQTIDFAKLNSIGGSNVSNNPTLPAGLSGFERLSQSVGSGPDVGGTDFGFQDGGGEGGGSGGYGGGSGGAAAPTIDFAKVNAMKSSINNVVKGIQSMYDALYGTDQNIATESTNKLNTRQKDETDGLTSQFNQSIPALQYSYAGRGLADSSFSRDAVNNAGTQFEQQIKGLGQEYDEQRGKIAGVLNSNKAGYDASKGGLDQLVASLGDVTDVDQLSQVISQLQTRQAELQGQMGGNKTQAELSGIANGMGDVKARATNLQGNLQNILAGQAPGPLKRQVGMQLIKSSGLNPNEQASLAQQFEQTLAEYDERQLLV